MRKCNGTSWIAHRQNAWMFPSILLLPLRSAIGELEMHREGVGGGDFPLHSSAKGVLLWTNSHPLSPLSEEFSSIPCVCERKVFRHPSLSFAWEEEEDGLCQSCSPLWINLNFPPLDFAPRLILRRRRRKGNKVCKLRENHVHNKQGMRFTNWLYSCPCITCGTKRASVNKFCLGWPRPGVTPWLNRPPGKSNFRTLSRVKNHRQ